MTKDIDQNKLKKIIEECQDFFGIKMKNPPKITFVYTREEIDEIAGRKTERWVRAITRRDGLYFIHPNKLEELTPHKNDDFWKVVKHEISHWLFNQITGTYNGEPRWFTEGLAMYMAGQQDTVPFSIEVSITSKYYSFTDNGTYSWGLLLVTSLINKFGKEKVVNLVKKIDHNITQEIFAKLFVNEFGISLSSFEKSVKKTLS